MIKIKRNLKLYPTWDHYKSNKVVFMKANGKMGNVAYYLIAKNMEGEYRYGKMVLYMKDIGNRMLHVEKAD